MTRVSVLQLDTHFPRVPGDVACPETYRKPPEILRIAQADVASVVRNDPQNLDITPFLAAAKRATGDIVTTSCGFLAPLEKRIASELDRPFLASSLNALPALARRYTPSKIFVLTYDATSLGPAHVPHPFFHRLGGTLGLDPAGLLFRTIHQDLPDLDPETAGAQVVQDMLQRVPSECGLLLLECTNLCPYQVQLRQSLGVAVYGILDRIEAHRPNTIMPEFL